MQHAYVASWYRKVIFACGMEPDLARLPEQDLTIVGDKGVQLSGGQKARVALARAVYSKADVVLLDGVLSALDNDTQTHVIRHVWNGLLAKKTVVLATHVCVDQLAAQLLLRVESGSVIIESTSGVQSQDVQTPAELFEDEEEGPPVLGSSRAVTSSHPAREHKLGLVSESPSTSSSSKKPTSSSAPSVPSRSSLARMMWNYVKLFHVYLVWIILTSIVQQAVQTGMDVWLGLWISRRVTTGVSFLIIYALLGIVAAALSYCRSRVYFASCTRVANVLHKAGCTRLFRAPVSYFDKMVTGTLSNILSKDQDTVDHAVPESVELLVLSALRLGAIALFNSALNPLFLAVIPLSVILFFRVTAKFLAVSKEVRRLENQSIAGTVAILKESLQGSATIRCFNFKSMMEHEYCQCMDVTSRANHIGISLDRWVGIRLELVSITLATAAAVISVLFSESIPPAFAGVAVVNCLNTSRTLLMLCRRMGTFQVQFMAVEQVMRLQDAPQEPSFGYSGAGPSTTVAVATTTAIDSDESSESVAWPRSSSIRLEHVSAKYHDTPTSPYCLTDLSLDIPAGAKVGIVGRSGSGKSSLFNALLRLLDVIEGEIVLGGVPARLLSYFELRRGISIIPQEPLLLKGTWRDNLDLDGKKTHQDSELWDALEQVSLRSKVETSPQGLDGLMSEGGSNLSSGEKQLVCLARASLRRAKFLLLDEVTANVDEKTDAAIQTSIKKHFPSCTILTIAHRLKTLEHCDFVLVMGDGGTLKAIVKPEELLNSSHHAEVE